MILHRKSHASLIIAALSSLLSWPLETGSQIKDLAAVGTVALNWWGGHSEDGVINMSWCHRWGTSSPFSLPCHSQDMQGHPFRRQPLSWVPELSSWEEPWPWCPWQGELGEQSLPKNLTWGTAAKSPGRDVLGSPLHFWGIHTGASPTGIQLHPKGEAAVTSQDLAKGRQCLRACNKVTSVEQWKLGSMLFQVCLLLKFYLKIVHLLFSLAK